MVKYIYQGRIGEIIPYDATFIVAALACEAVLPRAFINHPNINEVLLTKNVKRVGESAFSHCLSLIRVSMPGVTVVEAAAFYNCRSLRHLTAPQLVTIKENAFHRNYSLFCINFPSVRVVYEAAFLWCGNLLEAHFGHPLQKLHHLAFAYCTQLAKITIPLRLSLQTRFTAFEGVALQRVHLVKGSEIMDVISALQVQRWQMDMHKTINSIDQYLKAVRRRRHSDVATIPHGDCMSIITPPCREWSSGFCLDRWSRLLIRKITHYQQFHSDVIGEASLILMECFPPDVVERIFSYLCIPSNSIPDIL